MGDLYSRALKSSILISFIVLLSFSGNAQMECRSMIGAHLTPFKKDVPILWAIEGTMAPGMMTSPYDSLNKTRLNGGMLLAALDFSFKEKNHFYFEGGYKNWQNSKFVDKVDNSNHLGMRQAFYSYSGETTKIKIGLHETRMGDFFLIDERVMGASIDKEIGAFTFNMRIGSVNQDFARMGKFCANRHLYGILHPEYTERIGEKLGETNLAGFVINWNPHYSKEVVFTSSEDEFSSDSDEFSDNTDEFADDTDEFTNNDDFHVNHDFNEFGSPDEFADETKKTGKKYKLMLTNVALIVYDEFGSEAYIPDNKLYFGSLVDFILPYDFFFQTGGIYQNMLNNNTFVYIAKFGKSIGWNNASNTKISGAYIGKYDFDDNALFQPLFSNLFLGEIMRMDATEFPLWQLAVKHRFPGKMKFHVAFKAVAQIEDAKTNEQDIEVGLMAFKKHLKVTLIGSRVETQLLPNDFYMARVELRLAF
ncbi:MAG: hypothetical protein KAH25_01215 [Bacteroidales bacterium]|nr:hypothetical protein [Bacteroidales bacterium]